MKKMTLCCALLSIATGCLADEMEDQAWDDVDVSSTSQAISTETKPLWAFDKKSGADSLTSSHELEREWLLDDSAWRYVGVDGYVYTQNGANRAPIWRFWSTSSSDHLLTTTSQERNALLASPSWQEEGVLGYVSTVPQPGWTPMRRVWCPSSSNHISTANDERWEELEDAGCTLEGIQGYVESSLYPDGKPPCVPAGTTWNSTAEGWNHGNDFWDSGMSSISPSKKTVMVVGASVDARLTKSMRASMGSTHNTIHAWCADSNGFIDIAAWMLPEMLKRAEQLDKTLIGLTGEVLCPEGPGEPQWDANEDNVRRLRKLFVDHGLGTPTISRYPTNYRTPPWGYGIDPKYTSCQMWSQNVDNAYYSFTPHVQPWSGVYSVISPEDGLHPDTATADAAADVLEADWMP